MLVFNARGKSAILLFAIGVVAYTDLFCMICEDSMVEIRPLNIAEVKLVVPEIHRDPRGFLSETYSRREMAAAGIAAEFVQDNHSLSLEAGTLRGCTFRPRHTSSASLCAWCADRSLTWLSTFDQAHQRLGDT
jgi:hypothetical protein